jgi:hypothetical protein
LVNPRVPLAAAVRVLKSPASKLVIGSQSSSLRDPFVLVSPHS